MTNYLLLRNNKESGPYSIDDLVKLGLKAYDLVWVQGKSAAWRYPSELEELKPYAPITEEQPFDRFYKKEQVTGTKDRSVQTSVAVKSIEPAQEHQPLAGIAPEHEKYIPKKSVFVTLPGGVISANAEPRPAPAKEEAPANKELAKATGPIITVSENPNAAQVKYSQPLDDIKEMYVKTLHERKQKIARKNFWMQNLKRAAVIGGLVASGVVAGFLLRSNGSKKELVAQSRQVVEPASTQREPTKPVNSPVTENTNAKSQVNEAAAENVPTPSTPAHPMHLPTGGFVNKHEQEQPSNSTREADRKPDDKQNVVDAKKTEVSASPEPGLANSFSYRGAETDARTGERTRKVRGNNEGNVTNNEVGSTKTEQKVVASAELGGQVTVTCNDYKKVAFGGIRDLQLTLNNDSRYALENVIVELQYLKPNEAPLRTENVQFKSIGPNQSATIRIPDTNRGMRVSYRIIHIQRKGADETVAGN
jgi:hypothetical protein